MTDQMKVNSLSFSEMQERMDMLRGYFTQVRLFDEKTLVGGRVLSDGSGQPCFGLWKRDTFCENCVSVKALATKSRASKVEFTEDGVYQVIADYIEVDGKPCVLELINRFSDDSSSSDGNLTSADVRDYYKKIYVDVLTGANNRRYYEEYLKKSVITAGLAMIDLDDFKIYNDLFGHKAGDAVLSTASKDIRGFLRDGDRIIRYGGDEFLIVMPDITEEDFRTALKGMSEKVAGIDVPGFASIKISFSIGAVMCSDEKVEDAVNRADGLMYRAKKKKNVVFFGEDADNPVSSPDKETVLIVDDTEINREILAFILKNEYNVVEASGGKECIELLGRYGSAISIILLDIIMPDTDGFDVLKYMTLNHLIEDIPVITITGDESDSSVRKAYEMGVSDYINRPFDARVVYRRVSNTVNQRSKQKRLVSIITDEMNEKEKNAGMITEIFSQIVEFRNGYGGCHVRNIKKMTEMLLDRLVVKTDRYPLKNRDIFLISTASALHDIGKIAIGDEIINKPGKLTPDEYEEVRKHTVYGAEMINSLTEYRNEPLMKCAYEICRWHHERFDGKGYPDGLAGDDIPISAQVVSICDVYDALVSKRVYKDRIPHERAMKMISDGECGVFNPILLECLKDIGKKLKEIADEEAEGLRGVE